MSVTRKNPENVAPPIAAYSHLTIVPRDAELLVLSGQIGIDSNGVIPERVEDQLRIALDNITRILGSEGVATDGIVKINLWFTEPPIREEYVAIWNEFHRGNPPATTYAYVSALAQPHIKVEVEAWAARK